MYRNCKQINKNLWNECTWRIILSTYKTVLYCLTLRFVKFTIYHYNVSLTAFLESNKTVSIDRNLEHEIHEETNSTRIKPAPFRQQWSFYGNVFCLRENAMNSKRSLSSAYNKIQPLCCSGLVLEHMSSFPDDFSQ